jgi:transposase
MGSIEDREKLKEAYKVHYRAIRDLRQKAVDARRMASVNNALDAIQNSELMHRFDAALNTVNEHIARAEARLELYLDGDEHVSAEAQEVVQKEQARVTIQKMRAEMGFIQEELDQKIASLPDVKKSVGVTPNTDRPHTSNAKKTSNKTLGPRNTSS